MLILSSGQVFCWRRVNVAHLDYWSGVVGDVVFVLQISNNTSDLVRYGYYSGSGSPISHGHANSIIREYFNLDKDICTLQSYWTKADRSNRFRDILKNPEFNALRFVDLFHSFRVYFMLINQPVAECTLAFLVSQNNNVKRISLILNRIRAGSSPIRL